MADNWLTAEIATELAGANEPPLALPGEAIAFLAAIVEAPSFRSLYGDTAASPRRWEGSLEAFPPKDQIGAIGPDGQPTHPFGAWQWEPDTAHDIAAGIGTPSVAPDKQIRGSWWLAHRDYQTHTGGDLLTDLRAAGHSSTALNDIAAALRPTWPGGARAGFAQRYLLLLPGSPPAPGAPPPQITLHHGETRLVAIDGFDASGALEPLPANGGIASVDDEAVCAASVDQRGQAVMVSGKDPGATVVHFAVLGLQADLGVTVAALARIAFNPDRQPDPPAPPVPTG